MRSATMRAITSVLPPGAKPTVMVMVLLGKTSWAWLTPGAPHASKAAMTPPTNMESERMAGTPLKR